MTDQGHTLLAPLGPLVQGQADRAVEAFNDMTAGQADGQTGQPAAVDEKQGLLPLFKGVFEGPFQHRGQGPAATAGIEPQIDHVHLRQPAPADAAA
jgi:hypothetical protein